MKDVDCIREVSKSNKQIPTHLMCSVHLSRNLDKLKPKIKEVVRKEFLEAPPVSIKSSLSRETSEDQKASFRRI